MNKFLVNPAAHILPINGQIYQSLVAWNTQRSRIPRYFSWTAHA